MSYCRFGNTVFSVAMPKYDKVNNPKCINCQPSSCPYVQREDMWGSVDIAPHILMVGASCE